MIGCKKCSTVTGVVLLALGVIYLLGDLNIWNFWNIKLWTALLIYLGFALLCMAKCPDCRAMNRPVTGKRR